MTSGATSASDIIAREPVRFWTQRRRSLYLGYAAIGAIILILSSISDWRKQHMAMINATPSLPNWAFIVDIGKTPSRGDYIVFDMKQTELVRSVFGDTAQPWVKFAYGIAGDRVTVSGQMVLINGKPIARAKSFSRKAMPLHIAQTGVIPRGCYYVGTPHVDGFDSRYADVGLVCRHQVIGTARPIL